MYTARKISQFGSLLCASLIAAGTAHAVGEVSSIETSEQLGTPFQYDVDGETYSWGIGTNQILESVTVDGRRFAYANAVDRVELRRDDISDVATGIPCGVFVERLGASELILEANYPSEANGSGNCDMAEMLASRIVNRGALDVFSNKLPNPKNIERIDYVFDYGVLAPLSADAMHLGGHLAAEKRGNNPIHIGAILALDVLGQPAEYGPLVRIHPFGCGSDEVCYGVTAEQHNYSFFQSSSVAPQTFPEYLTDSTESVSMAYISAAQLGLAVGQKYYGFSYFPEDVDSAVHNLLDPSSFPNDTADDNILIGDGADIYGGLSAYFLADELSVASGKVFNDEDLDQRPDEVESGISGIEIKLYVDTDGNGVLDPGADAQLGSSFESNQTGDFVLPGLPNGTYFLKLDEQDSDVPPGLFLPQGSNPLMFVISSSDQDSLDFPFTDGVMPPDDSTDSTSGNTGGSSTSGTTSGSDSGNTTAGSTGGTDSGNNTSGSSAGTDSGNNTSGSTAGTDSGNNTSGSTAGTDSGNNTSGSTAGTDSGNNTSGSTAGTDSGNNTSGSTAGTDSGNNTSGSTAGTDSGNNTSGSTAGTDSGNNTSGSTAGTDSGNTTSGSTAGTDSGNTTSGSTAGTDSGNTTSGSTAGTDSGNTTGGSTDDGNASGGGGGDTDAGSTAGSTDSGTSDAGTVDAGTTDSNTDSGEVDGTGGDGMNPDGTVATPDTATVDQGETVIINVLDNDIDATGEGLTLIGEPDAPNGTVKLEENGTAYSYSPDFGFYGIDTFMYSIEDSAGNQATATVTIEVIRYSDINDNAINDYDECNCVSLTLESGIHGSGLAGRFEWLGLLALFGALIVRRGRTFLRVKGSRA